MAAYLEELDGARSQEGNALFAGFKIVKAITASSLSHGPPCFAVNQVLTAHLNEVQKKIVGVEADQLRLHIAHNLICAHVNGQLRRIDEMAAAQCK